MNVKILVDSDVELDDKRVEPGPVRASGEQYRTCGEIEVRANREQRANRLLHLFKRKAVFQATLNIPGENRNLPRRELVGVTWLCDTLGEPYQQKLVHLFAHRAGPRRDEAVRSDVGCQFIERLQHFHSRVEGLAHSQSGSGLNMDGINILA